MRTAPRQHALLHHGLQLGVPTAPCRIGSTPQAQQAASLAYAPRQHQTGQLHRIHLSWQSSRSAPVCSAGSQNPEVPAPEPAGTGSVSGQATTALPDLTAAESNGTGSGPVAAAATAAAAPAQDSSCGSTDGGLDGSSSDTIVFGRRAQLKSILNRQYTGELLFLLLGSALAVGLTWWTAGTALRRFNPYSFTLTLPEATGVVPGTPLRMKGVPVGSVLDAVPRLDRVEVLVEVNEVKTIIPRSSKFELTQQGLIPAAAIDITPPDGVSAATLTEDAARAVAAAAAAGPEAAAAGGKAAAAAAAQARRGAVRVRLAGPKEVDACRLQGVLVCQGDSLSGAVGGSTDELMRHTLRGMRDGEVPGVGVPGRGTLQG